MSAFTPVVPPVPHSPHAATLARFVPSALRRTPPVAKVWGPAKVAAVGVVTLGLWPFWPLQKRVRQTMTLHARQCDLAVDTLRPFVPADDGPVLKSAAGRVDVGTGPLAIAGLLWLVGVVCFLQWAATVWQATHGMDALLRSWHAPAYVSGVLATVALSGAYFLVIVQLNAQLLAMQQFALAYNAVCGERFGGIDLPPLVWGVRAWSVVIGVALLLVGPFWLLPMMLAWAAHAAFARESARTLRVQFAERLVAATGVEPVVPTGDVCPDPDCRDSVPADAKFCRRCGAAIAR